MTPMTPHTDSGGDGAVAVHRWFVTGEGWAFHPWFEPRMLDLMASLKPELENRRAVLAAGGRGLILRPALGGVLVGEQVEDVNCPDPVARGRFPTLLRVVYLPHPPSEPDRASITAQLARLGASAPGRDPTLSIPVAEAATSSPPTRPRRSWIPVGVGVLVVLLIAGVTWWPFPLFGRGTPTAEPTQAKKADDARKRQDKMQGLLAKWQGKTVPPDPRESELETARRFFQFLSQSQWGGKLKGPSPDNPNSHPDILFVERLPETAAVPRTEGDVDKALRSLVERLADDSSTGQPNPYETALQALDREMDFELWWGRTRHSERAYFNHEPHQDVSSFVRRAVSGRSKTEPRDAAELRKAATTMVKQLEEWKVKAVTAEDATDRPWLVFQCYFQLLSQQHLGKHVEGVPNSPSDWLRFVRRLPEKPLTTDGHFSSKTKLVDTLARLMSSLNPAVKSNQVEVLLEKVAREMDYDAWLKDAESPEVNRFVDRFRK